MPEAIFRVAHIVYVTNLTLAGAPIIPLGVFAEMSTDRSRGLALKARKALTAEERALVIPALRDPLADPFTYFRAEFNDAWDKAEPGKALDYLTRRHSASLSVLAPKDCEERNWLGSRLLHPRTDALEAKLIAAVDKGYAELWADSPKADSEKMFVEGKRAAA